MTNMPDNNGVHPPHADDVSPYDNFNRGELLEEIQDKEGIITNLRRMCAQFDDDHRADTKRIRTLKEEVERLKAEVDKLKLENFFLNNKAECDVRRLKEEFEEYRRTHR